MAWNVAIAWTFNVWINWIMMLTNTRTSRRLQTSLNAPHPTPPCGEKASPSRLDPHLASLGPIRHWQSLLVGHWLDVILYGFLVVISLIKKRLRTTSLSVIQQLSQLPLLHAIRYTTNRSIIIIIIIMHGAFTRWCANMHLADLQDTTPW